MAGILSYLFPSCFSTQVKERELPEPLRLPDVLIHIFKNLEAKDLAKCAFVCQHWNAVLKEHETHFYLSFYRGIHLLKDQIPHYPRLPRDVFFRLLKKLPEDQKQKMLLDPSSIRSLYDPFPSGEMVKENREQLVLFPYSQKKPLILACKEAGLLIKDDPKANRLLVLALYFGDKELVDQILKETVLPQEEMEQLLYECVILAFEAKQASMLHYLKSDWKMALKDVICINFDITAFNEENPQYREMIPFLRE